MNEDRQFQFACRELSRRLRAGEPCRSEDYLDAATESADRDSVLELLYTEFVVREELGHQPDPTDWYRRFPSWQNDLEELFQVHRYVAAEDAHQPAAETGAFAAAADTSPRATPPTDSGDRAVAGYQLHEEIGRGGMGVVYRAHQLSLGRDVALKMVLAGEFAAPQDLERFRNEAAAAASLQHPHIAQIYEAGEYDGCAYLSMELVEGATLETLLAKAPLTARSAAELLQTVAQAVHYAHQRGVIHRDLKPSNILITSDGKPKITDFGLAKRLQSDQDSALTRTGVVLGTPSYMPPEQALGRAGDLPAAVDVYALGAILYETLTGRPPFVGETAFETLQQVQQREPLAPREFDEQLPVDLETICLKCLEKDPQRRYLSAAELTDDLRRFLNDEPIVARPATAAYRLRKFARRNKRFVAGLATIFAVLLVAATATTIQAIRATQQKQIAEAETQFASEVNRFLSNIFHAITPQRAGNNVTMREALDLATKSIEEQLPEHPRVEAEIRQTIGEAYLGLGLYAEAEHHLTIALKKSQQWYDQPHGEIASALNNMGTVHLFLGQYDRAETEFNDALRMWRRLETADDPSIASALRGLATVYRHRGNYEAAEQAARQAVDIHRRLDDQEDGKVTALSALAYVLYHSDQLEEAERTIEEALRISNETFGEMSLSTANRLSVLSLIYAQTNRVDQAIEIQSKAVEIKKNVMGADHPDLAMAFFVLAQHLKRAGQLEEAEQRLVTALEILQRHLGPEHVNTLNVKADLGHLLMVAKRLEEAKPILQETLEMRLHLLGDHPDTYASMINLAGVHRRQGDYAAAAGLYERALEMSRRIHPADHPRTLEAMHFLALNTATSGDAAAALPIFREAFERRLATQGSGHSDTQFSLESLVEVLERLDRTDEAKALMNAHGAAEAEIVH